VGRGRPLLHPIPECLDFVGAKGDGGGGNNRSYKACKAPVNLSPPTNQHPVFYRPDALPLTKQQCQSTDGKALKMDYHAKLSSSTLSNTNREYKIYLRYSEYLQYLKTSVPCKCLK